MICMAMGVADDGIMIMRRYCVLALLCLVLYTFKKAGRCLNS